MNIYKMMFYPLKATIKSFHKSVSLWMIEAGPNGVGVQHSVNFLEKL